MVYLTFGFIIVLLGAVVAWQSTFVVVAKRKRQYMRKAILKEREATADIITLSRDTITDGTTADEFFGKFLAYAVRSMLGCGGVIMKFDSDRSLLTGLVVSGMFPPLQDTTQQLRDYVMAHPKKHTSLFREVNITVSEDDLESLFAESGYSYCTPGHMPGWLNERLTKHLSSLLIAPIRRNRKIAAVVIVGADYDSDSHQMRPDDGLFLLRLVATASLAVDVIEVFRERQEYEERLQTAKEEGMVQVSTGIIHNIGNAVTVAKLAIHELQQKVPGKLEERPDYFIKNELLPLLKKAQDGGQLESYLKTDSVGSQIFPMLDELLQNSMDNGGEQLKTLTSLSGKLDHITEIIDLQQRFVGELGTENMTQVASVVSSAIKIFEESFNKRGVRITQNLDQSLPEILIDPSMMTQVFINIVKNAIEAMEGNAAVGKDQTLDITLEQKEMPGLNACAVISIQDNGPGMTQEIQRKIFDFGFSTKRAGGGGYGLHSCMSTIKKYGGRIEVDSTPGIGTTFRVVLPFKYEPAPAAVSGTGTSSEIDLSK